METLLRFGTDGIVAGCASNYQWMSAKRADSGLKAELKCLLGLYYKRPRHVTELRRDIADQASAALKLLEKMLMMVLTHHLTSGRLFPNSCLQQYVRAWASASYTRTTTRWSLCSPGSHRQVFARKDGRWML